MFICSRLARVAAAMLLPALLIALLAPATVRADRIVLRDLTILQNRTVQSFDEDGVRLDGGQLVTWDEVERGTVAPAQQAQFDALLKELGEPLYRIRQRLRTGDYPGLVTAAEQVYPRYENRRGSRTGYVVAQALMWGRIAEGRRAEAVAPYFHALEFVRGVGGQVDFLPGQRRLRYDPATGMTPELPPIWFDAAAAARVLPEVKDAYGRMAAPRPESGVIYYVTLALAAGEFEEAGRVLPLLKGVDPATAELRLIVTAQRDFVAGQPQGALAALEPRVAQLSPAQRPLGLYWLARARYAADKTQGEEAVLELLRIPAAYGRDQPELAAAALSAAMEIMSAAGQPRDAVTLRTELLQNYPHTYHARALQSGGAGAARPANSSSPDAKETP